MFSGTNKLCQQCVRNCKQWFQMTVVRCRKFLSKRKADAKIKDGGILPSGQIGLDALLSNGFQKDKETC